MASQQFDFIMTNIVLPVNFSREVRTVLIAFIKQMQQKTTDLNFILLHAYDTPKFGFAMGHDISDVLRKSSISDLEYEKNEMSKVFPNLNITTYAEQGSLAKVLNEYDRNNSVDFAVLALKGSNMIQSLLADNRPSELARDSNVPVLFLPNTNQFQLPQNIVFGTDVKPFENKEDFKGLLKIFKLLKAHLQFLYVNENDVSKKEDFAKNYAKYLGEVEYSYTELEHEDAAKGILEFVKEQEIDGIALIERKGSFLKRLFDINVLDHMIENVELPILVINELRSVV